MSADAIKIYGARERNLKGISVSIPHRSLTVVTGPSGSGKSTLLFDLLGREAARQIALFSSGNQWAGAALPAGAVERITGLGFTLKLAGVPRSRTLDSLGRYLQIADLLAILFQRSGELICPDCRIPMVSTPRASMLGRLAAAIEESGSSPELTTVTIGSRLFPENAGQFAEYIRRFLAEGYSRVMAAGEMAALESPYLEFAAGEPFDLVIDRLACSAKNRSRLEEVLSLALSLSGDAVFARFDRGAAVMSCRPRCPNCNLSVDPQNIDDFRYWRTGGCAACGGAGEVVIKARAGRPRRIEPCSDCCGSRLNRLARSAVLFGSTLGELMAGDISAVRKFLEAAEAGEDSSTGGGKDPVIRQEIPALRRRFDLLVDLGLGYLTLNRAPGSISTGEMQRLRIARFLAQPVGSVTYLLDEPSAGLHPQDAAGVIKALRSLVACGDTVAVIDHDRAVISAADHLIVLGPGAGTSGGSLMFAGNPKEYTSAEISPNIDPPLPDLPPPGTAGWISIEHARRNNLKDFSAKIPCGCITAVAGVSGSGKSTLVRDCLVPLVQQAIVNNGSARWGIVKREGSSRRLPEVLGTISGTEGINAVIDLTAVSAKALRRRRHGGRGRAVVGTVLGVMRELRSLYSLTVEARLNGFAADRFSFLNPKSYCEQCRGFGTIQPGLPGGPETDEVCCDICGGNRFRPEILEVQFKGISIGAALAFTIEEAANHFSKVPRIRRLLRGARQLGLSYLTLGQPAATLSTGEMQRLRLAARLHSDIGRNKLIVLDEPSLGLDRSEVLRLAQVLRTFAKAGNTVVVVEHNLDLIQAADWIVEIGPRAGTEGGRVIASGPAAQFCSGGPGPAGSLIAAFLRNNQ